VITSDPNFKNTEEQQAKCRECMECCKYVEVPTSMLDLNVLEYWLARGDTFYIDNNDGVLHVRFYKPCVHLKDDGCDIYENRPYTCRVYMCLQKDKSILQIKDDFCKTAMERVAEKVREFREKEKPDK